MNLLISNLPYMPESQVDWLARTLTKDMNVFEWGSGGSTLFIAPRVSKIVSIESSKRWYLKVRLNLLARLIFNCTLVRILPETTSEQSPATETFRSSGKYGHLTYKKYVESIDSYPDEHFDLIIVDGRCRKECLLHARNKIKKGGYIFLDDADREHYKESINSMIGFGKTSLDRSLLFKRLD